jgi:hypothetical protein
MEPPATQPPPTPATPLTPATPTLTAHAHVPTPRAARYLAQLAKHTSHLSALRSHLPGTRGSSHPPADQQHQRPIPLRTEYSPSEALIDFGWARCVLTATETDLVLRGEAETQAALTRLTDAVTHRLQQIGKRDNLTVTWLPGSPTGAAANSNNNR